MYNLSFSWIFTVVFLIFGKSVWSFLAGKDLLYPFARLEGAFGPKQCLKECLLRKRCKAIGYSYKYMYCHLGRTEDTKNGLDEFRLFQGVFNVTHDQSFLGVCASHGCAVGEKCIVKEDGTSKCVVSDCNAPLTMSGCHPKNSLGSVGTKVEYQSTNGYRIVGTNGITCKANGQWTTPAFTCRKVCSSPYNEIEGDGNYMCYRKSTQEYSYVNAVKACEEHGGRLIRLDTEWRIVTIQAQLEPKIRYYVDGEKNGTGLWVYGDGSLFKKVKTGEEIHGGLADVYGSSAPSYAQVKFWVGEFKRGKTSLGYEARSGCHRRRYV